MEAVWGSRAQRLPPLAGTPLRDFLIESELFSHNLIQTRSTLRSEAPVLDIICMNFCENSSDSMRKSCSGVPAYTHYCVEDPCGNTKICPIIAPPGEIQPELQRVK